MIGQTLETRNPPVTGAIWWLLAAVICLGLAFATQKPGWGVLAILPALMGVACLLTQEPEFHAEVTPRELIVHSLNQVVSYPEIKELWYAGGDARAVYVTHSRGLLRIPRTSKFSASEIYTFLTQMLPRKLVPQINPAISNYFQSHLRTFGADRVWAHTARTKKYDTDGRRRSFVGYAIFATVILWCIGAAVLQEPGWAGVAILGGIIALLVYVLQGSLSSLGRGIKNWRDSSLVVSPAGLALAQGDLKGELRWKEIRSLRLKDKGPVGRRRIEVRVEGALITIFDFYDSPISEIHRQIERYWTAG
jgi:hypothetical protein